MGLIASGVALMLPLKCMVKLISTLLLTLAWGTVFAQTKFSSDPDSSVFLTSDIDNFWKAFDDFKKEPGVNPFQKEYLDIGSAGVKNFIPDRIQSADHLWQVVKEKKNDYEKVRATTFHMRDKEKQCRSTFYALKYWYPEATFPPVYFVIGAWNSGGTSTEAGLMIGSEKQADVNKVPYIVAHELIHFQQKHWPQNPTLLQQSIMEGSADFLGELISGATPDPTPTEYGDKNEARLCKEFVARMDSTDYRDWLYGVSKKDDRPNDLGYWIGYRITERYFRKADDRFKAIREMLDIEDYQAFLKKSGFLENYLH
jgi:uncharacterized protein YjaZ